MKIVLLLTLSVAVCALGFKTYAPYIHDLQVSDSYMSLLNKVEDHIRNIYKNVTHTNLEVNREHWFVSVCVEWDEGRIFGSGYAKNLKSARNLAAFNALLNAEPT